MTTGLAAAAPSTTLDSQVDSSMASSWVHSSLAFATGDLSSSVVMLEASPIVSSMVHTWVCSSLAFAIGDASASVGACNPLVSFEPDICDLVSVSRVSTLVCDVVLGSSNLRIIATCLASCAVAKRAKCSLRTCVSSAYSLVAAFC